MLTELNEAWDKLADTTRPPVEDVLLYQDESVTVFVDNKWGPPVPYPPAPREEGRMNHGYVRLKGNPEMIERIPEAKGWPEYQQFLRRINADTSPIEFVGCEKGHFPCYRGEAKVQLGSYTDVIFTETSLNDEPRNFLKLADAFGQAMRGSREWWSIAEIAIQRSKGFIDCNQPWLLMLRVLGHGRDEAMARQSWGVSKDRIGQIIGQIPPVYFQAAEPS